MIQKLIIRNFKCLRDVTVDLEPFTVFVGANGSGKTSILQALDLLCRTYHSQLKQLESEYLANRTFGSVEAVELASTVDGENYQYQVPSAEVKNSPAKRPGGLRIETTEGQAKPPKGVPRSLWLRLDVNLLRNTDPLQNIRDMGSNGQGMHRALSSMLLERRDVFFQLEKDLNRIVPSIKGLRPTAEHEIRFDTVNGSGLPSSQISEGSLLTLGLLTAIHAANKPGLLLLDDIDRALHPRAQWELIGLLRGVLQTNPEIQIVATTHSPYLLDKMEPKEVRVTTLRADGSAATEPMTQHPKYEKWKEEFHSGEMWSVFGEEWVAEPLGVAQSSLRFAIVHEAKADFSTATDLADRVLCESISWLDDTQLPMLRSWITSNRAGFRLTWSSIKQSAQEMGVRAHGHFKDGPGLADATSARRAIEYLLLEFQNELDGVLLIRDQDSQPERRHGLEQARSNHSGKPVIVIGFAVIEREAWVICGFDPQDDEERIRLDEERQLLGFNPCEKSHELTAGKDNTATKSPKRVLSHLTRGHRDRERHCWVDTPLNVLRSRGVENGLTSFLAEVQKHLAPLLGYVKEHANEELVG